MNLPTIKQENGVIDYTHKQNLDLMRQTVAKGATNEEFAMFLSFCQSTGLNPFKKEIWFIKTNQGVQMMSGINGFYAIANKHPMFDGIEIEEIENDKGIPIKVVAKVYRKDRKFPQIAIARMSEYGKSFGTWKTMPFVMLGKCAESMALRKAFPQELNGLYSQEEMPREFEAPKTAPVNIVTTKEGDVIDAGTGEVLAEAKPIKKAKPAPIEPVDDDMPEWMNDIPPPEDAAPTGQAAFAFDEPEGREGFSYKLPFHIEGVDMKILREKMKSAGYKFNPQSKCWDTKSLDAHTFKIGGVTVDLRDYQ